MAVVLRDLLRRALPELRVQPIDKRLRGLVGDRVVLDTTRAVLVWEPRRVLPEYAVPLDDLLLDVQDDPTEPIEPPAGHLVPAGTPFAVHTAPGSSLSLLGGDLELPGAAFRHDDPDLAGYVVLDSGALDAWWEEDEQVLGHPRDPLHRIECLPSSRRVVVRHGDVVLADSTRAVFLFEPPLPVRYYLPREDVRLDLLVESEHHTVCPYKGVASYWHAGGGGGGTRLDDVAWTYPEALHDAVPVQGMVCFYPEKVRIEVADEGADTPG